MRRIITGILAGSILGGTGMSINSGPHTHMQRADVAVDFQNIQPLSTEIVTVAMPGAEVGDAVLCNASESLGATVMLGTCTVLGADTVSIKAGNFKGDGPIDPASQTMHLTLFKAGY